MSLFAIDILCEECGHCWDDLVERGTEGGKFTCPDCGSPEALRTISKPNPTRASYVDGKKRFGDLREANALKRERTKANSAQNRSEITKEIRKLGIKDYTPG